MLDAATLRHCERRAIVMGLLTQMMEATQEVWERVARNIDLEFGKPLFPALELNGEPAFLTFGELGARIDAALRDNNNDSPRSG